MISRGAEQTWYALLLWETEANHNWPPTIRELCALTGFASKCTVHAHLRALTEAGAVEQAPRSYRTIPGTTVYRGKVYKVQEEENEVHCP